MLNRLLLLSVSELIRLRPDLAAVKQVTVLFPRAVVPHKVCQQCVKFECTFTTAWQFMSTVLVDQITGPESCSSLFSQTLLIDRESQINSKILQSNLLLNE